MIFAVIKNNADERNKYPLGYCVHDYDELHRETFSPDVDTLAIIPLRISGKTYAEKKDSARNLAIEVQRTICQEAECNVPYGTHMILGDFFEKIAKRFGLLREFRENAII